MPTSKRLNRFNYILLMAQERCSLCPHEADLNPAPPLEDNPPFTHFRCGHRVHTQCFIVQLSIHLDWFGRVSCPDCAQRVLNDGVLNYLRDYRDYDAGGRVNTVANLWETNEVFREQVREAAKLERDAAKKRRVVKLQVDALKKEWKEKTDGYRTILKNMRDSYIRRFREIQGRREMALATGKARRMKTIIRQTYDLGYYELERINRIRGAPKIGGVTRRWNRFYVSHAYAFRFWL